VESGERNQAAPQAVPEQFLGDFAFQTVVRIARPTEQKPSSFDTAFSNETAGVSPFRVRRDEQDPSKLWLSFTTWQGTELGEGARAEQRCTLKLTTAVQKQEGADVLFARSEEGATCTVDPTPLHATTPSVAFKVQIRLQAEAGADTVYVAFDLAGRSAQPSMDMALQTHASLTQRPE